MKKLATKIKSNKYQRGNPFEFTQFRDASDGLVASEFIPTDKYWNRFNDSNEILIGTRGCGKTILLRMLSFSLYSKASFYPESDILKSKKYLGIYIPLRLRILKEIEFVETAELRARYFSFLFNCLAASALIREIIAILDDRFSSDVGCQRLIESKIINGLADRWDIPTFKNKCSLRDVTSDIDLLYKNVRQHLPDTKQLESYPFKLGILEPVFDILKWLNNELEFENDTTWMACFDEAEYLPEQFQKVINTQIRSESRGLSVKVATLPYKWSTLETEDPDHLIRPDGDDFNYVCIDNQHDNADFKSISNAVIKNRLIRTGLYGRGDFTNKLDVISDFVGSKSINRAIDLYKRICNRGEITQGELYLEVAKALDSRPLSRHLKANKGQLQKFQPIFVLRELYKMSKMGNTKVPYLSSPEMVYRMSGGNMRRLMQIMRRLFESARVREITDNVVHETMIDYAGSYIDKSSSVNREGFILHEFITSIARFLESETHGEHIKDVGTLINVTQDFLSFPKFVKMLEAGIAHGYLCCDEKDRIRPLTCDTKLYLSDAIAGYYWIYMRAGAGIKINTTTNVRWLVKNDSAILSRQATAEAIKQLELDIT